MGTIPSSLTYPWWALFQAETSGNRRDGQLIKNQILVDKALSTPGTVFTNMCTYVCTYVCMYVYMYACTYVCMYACMHACMHACMYVPIYIYMYMYTRRAYT